MGANGYRVKLSGPDCLLRSGTVPYWNIDFANLLRGVNSAKTVNEVVFPNPVADPDYAGVSYALTDESGHEILKSSCSLKERPIPARCFATLQAAIDQMHIWADDPRVPMGKREFCKHFRLPDPKKDPDAYRITGGPFSHKLHVLWGYEKEGSEAFLPASKISEKWDDAKNRKYIVDECKRSLLGRIFSLNNILLALLLVFCAYMGLFFPAKCPIHGCLIERGVQGVYLMACRLDESCPMRCSLPNCNRHLDEKGRCNAHKCTNCGRKKPLSGDKHGVCDDCFLNDIR